MKVNEINHLKKLILDIQRYENYRLIGYLTVPIIIGFFILKKVNPRLDLLKKTREEIIKNLENFIKKCTKQIEKNYSDIIKKDSYLIYSEKNECINQIDEFMKSLNFIVQNRNSLPENLIKLSKVSIDKSSQFLIKINEYNKEFIKKKKKEYAELFKRKHLILDDDQQTAVITDDKHNLVVAGAGSGKTEVLITRIAYLVKRKSDKIKPEKILALAFQNKAAEEIQKRLKERYKVESIVPKDISLTEFSKVDFVTIGTFHSLGNKIIQDYFGKKTPRLKEECKHDSTYQRFIQNLFEKEVSNDKKLQNEIISFMKCYGDSEIIKEEIDFEKKEEYYNYLRNLTHTALDGTPVKSESEKTILNFFLMHKLNGGKINIIYENPAEWMKYLDENGKEHIPKPDFWFPEFDIYLEHWAIDKENKVPEWFKEYEDKNYIRGMQKKREKFNKQNKYLLVETYSWEALNNNFIETIKNRFLEALKKKHPEEQFEFVPLSYRELVESVWESAQFVKHFPINISNFIVIAKTYNLSPLDIEKRLIENRWTPKQIAFANIAVKIYHIYQNALQKDNSIDFSDMINLAVDVLKKNKNFYKHVYDQILIDEYQDISKQRFELIKELMEKNLNSKLFCVGDDWQSIMGFAGSNLDFFIHFDKYFDHPERTDLTKNYRSIKSVVEAGACIIKNNKNGQIEKKTVSYSNESIPFLVYSSLHEKNYYVPYYEQVAKHCLDKIKEYHDKKNYSYDDILVLMRIASEKKRIWEFIDRYSKQLGIPIIKESHITCPDHVRFMSVHKSKGLQARVVIILNVDEGLYGFPCELENPEIFATAIQNNDGLREEEERRLFYVAVTRSKNEVIMYTQKCSESKFITEIKDFIKKEELDYKL